MASGRVSLTPLLSRVRHVAAKGEEKGVMVCDVPDAEKQNCLPGDGSGRVDKEECFSHDCCFVPDRLHVTGPQCYTTEKHNPLAGDQQAQARQEGAAESEQHGYKPSWANTYLNQKSFDFTAQAPILDALEWENRVQFAEIMTY